MKLRADIVGVGLAVLLFGVVIFGLAVVKVPQTREVPVTVPEAYTEAVTVRVTRTESLIPQFTEYFIPVGGYHADHFDLDAGVTWDIWASSGLGVDFYVMDEANFRNWVSGEPSTPEIVATIQGLSSTFTTSWPVPHSGTWYFVFVDRNPISGPMIIRKDVGVQVSRTYVEDEVQYNTLYRNVTKYAEITVEQPLLPSELASPMGLVMILGVLILGYGVIAMPQPHADER